MTALYVPSRGRSELLRRTVPAWLGTGLPLTVVVRPEDVEDYSRVLFDYDGVRLMVLGDSDHGIGWARQRILEDAWQRGHRVHIQADDDHLVDENLGVLIDACTDQVPSVACWLRIYGHFFGPPQSPVILCWNGAGEGVKAINTSAALDVGGFDTELGAYEDAELGLRMARAGYLPKRIHSGTEMKPINQRGDEGGCKASYAGNPDVVVHKVLSLLQVRYGDKVARLHHPKRLVADGRTVDIRINWQWFWKSIGVDKTAYELLT